MSSAQTHRRVVRNDLVAIEDGATVALEPRAR
jgi:hypothetical protein